MAIKRKSPNETVHQRVISRLQKRLKKELPEYKIFRNLEYQNFRENEVGECDLLALVGFYNKHRRYALLFEVKTCRARKSIDKCFDQLDRAEREIRSFYGSGVRCFKFYVYSSNNYFNNRKWQSKPYKIRWIRKKEK